MSKLLSKLHMTLPQFHGKNGLPYRKSITTIVGRPLQVEKTDGDPTQAQVDELHSKYIDELRKMYDEHKVKYGYDEIPLEIMW